MNRGHDPSAALDDILAQVRHLLVSFDGPICPLSEHAPSAQIASQLRDLIRQRGITLPSEIEQAADWRKILVYAATVSPQLAETVESELTKIESSAADAGTPTSYLHEMVTACRDSGHSLTVISDTSAAVIRSYLEEHSLDNAIPNVIARTPHDMAVAKHDQIEQAVNDLGATPATCAFLSAAPTDIHAARNVGTHSIGYARTTGDRNDLASAETQAVISSLAEITLRLRARYGKPPT